MWKNAETRVQKARKSSKRQRARKSERETKKKTKHFFFTLWLSLSLCLSLSLSLSLSLEAFFSLFPSYTTNQQRLKGNEKKKDHKREKRKHKGHTELEFFLLKKKEKK